MRQIQTHIDTHPYSNKTSASALQLKPTVRARDRHTPAEVVSMVAPVFSDRMIALQPEPDESTWAGQVPRAQLLHASQNVLPHAH